ncbi:MAG: Fe(3+) ions import ATP-binding protein FbpC [Paracidovorax wautersii]|uniref:Fe(3+) ions import ATP-binding protein FbpC n=1 Tax=Paracidovorax wautersii TaxID=1177982 RepID=A0A7V8FQ61_9BURK|nr:MAG: Fe(3+) ions import ATP-binding protein FbpC [Paracidovorax wautersii]
MTVALQLRDVTVAYPGASGPQRVLDGFTLALEAGELGCLLGPSGCGKTTALRAIAGFEPVLAGRIELGESLLSAPGVHLPPERRRVGMVFQDYALFPHLNARQNVAFGLRALPSAQREPRALAMLELVGLKDLAGRYPHELSGGQQQRVAVARALAPAPALLLMDEPFSNLDPATRERLGRDVRAILREAGQTALMVTHNEAEADAMADRIGRMAGGRLQSWLAPVGI